MARHEILAALIAAAGTRQADRLDPHLDPASAPLDDRDVGGLLRAAAALAGHLNYYGADPRLPSGNWSDFLPQQAAGESNAAYQARLAALAGGDGGELPPHLALLVAAFRVAAHPRALLNDFTRKHLDFQMQTVLGFAPRPPVPDRVHVLVELKKGAAPLEIGADARLAAGKDASQQPMFYLPVRPMVATQARIASLRSIALGSDGRLRFAPVADSANGLGALLTTDPPSWHPFGVRRGGEAALPDAPVGFALASAVLRLAEGSRQIDVSLELAGIDPARHSAALLADAFEARLSGPKGWLGPVLIARADSTLAAGNWSFSLRIGGDQPAIVDASPAVHQQAFPAGLPVLQLLLKEGSAAFGRVSGLNLRRARIGVKVDGLRTLALESDFGQLDPKKAFLPFGPQPGVGTRFYVGGAEALGKRLSALSLQIGWQGAPTSQAALTALYANYSGQASLASGVWARAEWADAAGAHPAGRVSLAPAAGGRAVLDLSASSRTGQSRPYRWITVYEAFARAGSAYARQEAGFLRLRRGVASDAPTAAAPRAGFITLSLDTDLLHAAWRSEAVAGLLATPKVILGEPWTPKAQEISLSYQADAGPSRVDDDSDGSFANAEVEFFHVDAFGVSREHAWLSGRHPWLAPGPVPLLPPHWDAGELFIGLSGLAPGDPLSLLFQVAEGSADPLANAQRLSWAVLADNAWRPLASGVELTLDTSRDLRASGLVSLVLPTDATTDNTRLPAGLIWLRAAIATQPEAACRLVGVHANAFEAVFEDHGNAADHLASALPAGRITRFQAPAPTIKAVSQPYASFGGALQEDASALARRAAERLRHRNRAIARWDYERLVLQAFPAVERVKCIPHASDTSWLAPGHVRVVVVPDLRNRNAVDPLQPRVDLDTLERIKAYLLARAPMGLNATTLAVRNPAYRAVQVDFKVAMRTGYAFSYYRAQINQALLHALSPWAFDAGAALEFGGRVLRSALVDFVEGLPWVDYVTDFRLYFADLPAEDRPELAPDAPDVILVSVPEHLIAEVS